MAEQTPHVLDGVADDLFDKYLLPKVALAVILLASLLGTAVSLALAGRWSPVVAIAKWLYFVALGVLTGGLLWQHGFVRPGDLETGARAYCAEMYARFDRVVLLSLVAFAPGSYVALRQYATALESPLLPWALAAAVAGVVAVAGVTAVRDRPVERRFRSPAGVAALCLATAAVVLTALAEVALAAGGAADAAVRVLHLLAFSAWVGGAVWNIFVAVPTGQARPTTAVVRAAGEQLERFRWTVRFVIPTILLTGLHQAAAGVGTRLPAYVGSAVGVAVLAKLGFVGLLVVIFKTCPMWRACSPIDGVCDVTDLTDDADRTREREQGREGKREGAADA